MGEAPLYAARITQLCLSGTDPLFLNALLTETEPEDRSVFFFFVPRKRDFCFYQHGRLSCRPTEASALQRMIQRFERSQSVPVI